MLFLLRKLFRKFVILEVLSLFFFFGFWRFLPEWTWAAFISIVVIHLVTFFSLISYPLNLILREVKALLTGKQYNRIYTQKIDEIGVLAHFFNEVTRSLERVSTDIKEHRRISTELNVAQKIQRDLLPQSAPNIPGLDIIAKTKPAAEIGGDSFDFITKGDQTFLYIGDVTGHGVPSGLVMMIVDTLIHTFSDMVENSQQLLTQVNKYLKPRIQSTMFMTMVMFRWKHPTKEIFYTGAGHESVVHYKLADQLCENLKCGGIALGMIPDNSKLMKEVSIPWSAGDFIVLYTDGIVEARSPEGEMFGIDRLIKIVNKWAPNCTSAEMLFQKIATKLTLFVGEHIQEDDMTLIVIRNGETQEMKTSKETMESTQWELQQQEAKSLVDYSSPEVEESGLKQTS